VNSGDVIMLLRRHYRMDIERPGSLRPPTSILATEVCSPDGSRRADAIWATATMSGPPLLIGHEIKVSRADVLSELRKPDKAEAWAPYCNEWWLTLSDASLADGLDIPSAWGIMAPPSGRRTRSMTIVRPAAHQEPVNSAAAWRNVLAWLSYRTHAPTLPPSSRERGSSPAKVVQDRRLESADETDLSDDRGTG